MHAHLETDGLPVAGDVARKTSRGEFTGESRRSVSVRPRRSSRSPCRDDTCDILNEVLGLIKTRNDAHELIR